MLARTPRGPDHEGYVAVRDDEITAAAQLQRTPPSCYPRRYPAPRSNNLLLGHEAAIIEAGVVPVQCLLGPVARAYQRSGDTFEEAARQSTLAVAIELRGRDVALDGQVVRRRTQILSQSDDVDARRAQVGQRLLDLLIRLTQTQHQAALGQYRRHVLLRMREHSQRLLVPGARISHRMGEASHGLDVLRKDIESGVDDRLDVFEHSPEVRRQCFNSGRRIASLDRTDAGSVVAGAAVRQIVAIDRGKHDVFELHQLDAAGSVLRFVRIEPTTRVAGIDRAEAAGSCADRAHEHDRGGAGVPALADVRAFRLLADGSEAVLLDDPLDGLKADARGRPRAQPGGLAAAPHRNAWRLAEPARG